MELTPSCYAVNEKVSTKKCSARAAVAVGVAGVFIETHQEPDYGPCDGPNMIDVADLQKLIEKLRLIDELSKAI